MNEKELWKYFLEKKVSRVERPFDRDFLWILRKDFEKVKRNFLGEINWVHKGKSLRSRSWFRHIHAVFQGEHVFVHKDFGNKARFLPLGILHLVVDVIPYFFFCLVKRKSFGEAFVCPLKIKKS